MMNMSHYDNFKVDFTPPKDYVCDSGYVIKHKPYKKYLRTDIARIFEEKGIVDPFLKEREIVAQVFPFKINQHVVDIIDWDHYHFDPLFQLTFPQPGMLEKDEISCISHLNDEGASRDQIAEAISKLRSKKNPAPANQSANRPTIFEDDDSYECEGLQHKYKNTCLMFHKNAQTCHAYCTYCFRFNQFVGKDRFLEDDSTRLHTYIKQHPEISDILVTGGDPGTMKADVFRSMLMPLTEPDFAHIKNIRVGTKALTYHPYRFLTEPDADDLLGCFKDVISKGKHISIMAHFSHFNEITPETLAAVKRLRQAGCNIRTQAPIMRYINDNPTTWAKMWEMQVQNGMIPYYMFIARDTGPQRYFEVPLAKALYIYQEARKKLSGLSHTARGPSMSSGPGKVCVMGKERIGNEEVFILKFLQARNNDWCDRVFFAKYDEKATWLDNLVPAFGDKEFFFEEEYKSIINAKKKVEDLCPA
ncbi:lysine 2,3-aminomutase [Candidatus Marinamargulisbacteria bacterium SCGC AG-343-D04]|nr:lysine 2,3-aminomutase [Candidatus Marinamargulisbacteria bacterium SCGC AG-343-D04]